MRKILSVLACVSMIALATPASAKNAGMQIDGEVNVRKDGNHGIQRNEPGLELMLLGNVSATQAVDVGEIRFNGAPPPEWAKALAPDYARAVPIPVAGEQLPAKDGKGEQMMLPLQRVVFRALYVPEGGGPMEPFNAIVLPDASGFVALMPPGWGATKQGRGNLVIVSSEGRYFLTSRGESIDLKNVKGAKLKKGRLPDDFFASYPSPLPPVRTLTRQDPEGDGFLRSLESLFPERYRVRGRFYSGRPHAGRFLAAWTSLNSFGDKMGSCGNVTLSGIDPLSAGISLVTSTAFSAFRVMGTEDCVAKGAEKALKKAQARAKKEEEKKTAAQSQPHRRD